MQSHKPTNSIEQQNLLFAAVESTDPKVFIELLEKGASIEKDSEGSTILDHSYNSDPVKNMKFQMELMQMLEGLQRENYNLEIGKLYLQNFIIVFNSLCCSLREFKRSQFKRASDNGKSSREFLYKNYLSHHRTSVVAYGGFILIFRKLLLKREQANSFEPN
jgi:hypothetical protein